jgi:hypothetical protein
LTDDLVDIGFAPLPFADENEARVVAATTLQP